MVLFVAVAKVKSFSRAARDLDMPIATISRRVADLEGQLGVQLLLRTTRQVELTDVGTTYFARCRSIVEAAEAAQAELHGETESPRGQLRISASADYALTFLTPLFVEFSQRYPEISFVFDLTPRSVDLIAESFDVAIRMGKLPDSQLIARRIGLARRGLFAAPAYVARAGQPAVPQELAQHECVRLLLTKEVEHTWALTSGESQIDVQVSGRFVANSIRFLLQLAMLGMGIVAIDVALADPEVAAGRLVRVLPQWHPPAIPVHALTPGRLLPAKTKLFLDYLAKHLQDSAHSTADGGSV